MIFEKLRLKMWVNALRSRKKVLSFNKPVSLQKQMNNASRICICMPKDPDSFYAARECLQMIKKSDHWILLVLGREMELLAEHSGKTEVYPHTSQKPFPIQEESVKKIPTKFDIAIDLSPNPTPLTAYITGTRGKKMTIGLKSGELDPFYTALVNPHDDYKTSVKTMLGLAGFEFRDE
jgi:hypothetical protein